MAPQFRALGFDAHVLDGDYAAWRRLYAVEPKPAAETPRQPHTMPPHA